MFYLIVMDDNQMMSWLGASFLETDELRADDDVQVIISEVPVEGETDHNNNFPKYIIQVVDNTTNTTTAVQEPINLETSVTGVQQPNNPLITAVQEPINLETSVNGVHQPNNPLITAVQEPINLETSVNGVQKLTSSEQTMMYKLLYPKYR